MYTPKLTSAERRENVAEFRELVRQAEDWAAAEDHPYKHDYLCTIMYLRACVQSWPLERVNQALKGSRAARERRSRDATGIALGSALGGVGIAVCGLVFSSATQTTKVAALPFVSAIVGLITAWLVSPRVGYDRERIREREWNSVASILQDRRTALLKLEKASHAGA